MHGRAGRAGRARADRERFVAVHEAGHAVAAIVLGMGVRSVELARADRDGDVAGLTRFPRRWVAEGETGRATLEWLTVVAAGPMAELAVNPHDRIGGALDRIEFRRAAEAEWSGAGAARLKAVAAMRALKLVVRHRVAIRAVADVLAVNRYLTGADVRRIVAESARGHVTAGGAAARTAIGAGAAKGRSAGRTAAGSGRLRPATGIAAVGRARAV